MASMVETQNQQQAVCPFCMKQLPTLDSLRTHLETEKHISGKGLSNGTHDVKRNGLAVKGDRGCPTPDSETDEPSFEQLSLTSGFTMQHVQEFVKIVKLAHEMGQKEEQPKDEAKSDTAEEKKEDEKKEPEVVRPTYKTVREVWNSEQYRFVIEDAKQDEKEEEDKEKHVFVFRQRFDEAGKKSCSYIDVKSEILADIMRDILKDVTTITLGSREVSVESQLVFLYLAELEAVLAKHEDSTCDCAYELGVLIKFLKRHYESTINDLADMLEKKEIRYDLLWAIFKPNELLYTMCAEAEEPRCLMFNIFEEKQYQSEKWSQVSCRYYDFDGKAFGEAPNTYIVPYFKGTKKIRNLSVYPFKYHEQQEAMRKQLAERGRKLISLRGVHCKQCDGNAFFMTRNGALRYRVKGKMIVDAVAFKDENPDYNKSNVDRSSDLFDDDDFDDSEPDKRIDDETMLANLTEDQLICCSPTVLGFSFTKKRWFEFPVSIISEVEWNPEPFKSLVIGDENKMIIQALAGSQTPEQKFDDVVKGKGKGIIFLLHGPPGVGKTLTAEGLSEHLHRPLYMVCAGDLGIDSTTLESRLSAILTNASRWNAVLLLDEADVFLEQRSSHGLQQNALVSVFLRLLEYFEGTMFLTTNRVSAFDEAIQSRIHFTLKYDELTASARREIWSIFIAKAEAAGTQQIISKKQLERYIQKPLNGRQIKNTIKIAYALASYEGEAISSKHFDVAIASAEQLNRDYRGGGAIDAMHSYT